MVFKRQCSFCAGEIEPGTGSMFVKRDGSVFHFCTSSCRKQQLHLGRVGHRLKWTRAHALKRAADQASAPTAAKGGGKATAPPAKPKKPAEPATAPPAEEPAKPEPAEKEAAPPAEKGAAPPAAPKPKTPKGAPKSTDRAAKKPSERKPKASAEPAKPSE